MASIIIDGYNLIGTQHRDLEAERQRLLGLLAEYKKNKDHSIIVVFDGWKNGGPTETRTISGGVEVIYSRLGERADTVIKRLITGDRRHIVVTSDREIQAHAWSQDSVPIEAEEFLRILEQGPDYAVSGYQRPKGKKGSPRQLSKKDRVKKQALEKL